MKSFLKRVTLFLLLLAVSLLGVSRLYIMQLHSDDQMRKDGTVQYKYMPEKIELAVFGSSHAKYAVQWDTKYAGEIFLFADDAQNLLIDRLLFDTYADRFSDGAVVLLSVSPFLLFTDTSDSLNNLDQMKRYSTFLPFDRLPNAKLRLYRLFRALDFDTRVPVAWACEGLGLDTSFLPHSGFVPPNLAEVPEEEILAGAPKAPADMAAENQKWRDTPYSASSLAALSAMLDACEERGLRAVLFTPPYTHYYTDNDAPAYRARITECIQDLCNTYDVPYFDYGRDARFMDTLSYFMDIEHMNMEGSAAFVPVLMEDVRSFFFM